MSRPTAASETIGWLVLAGLFVGLSVVLGHSYYVGTIHDDAHYLLAAIALRAGSYSQLQAPGHPPITLHPPGYPLLLAAFLGFSRIPWIALRALSGLCLLASGWFLKRLAPKPIALPVTALFLLHPITLLYATTLMSDPLYTLCVVLSFFLLDNFLKQPTTGKAAALSGLAGFTVMTRTAGVLILPAIGIGLWTARRRKLAVPILLGAALIAGLFPLRNYLLGQTTLGLYSTIWQFSWEQLPHGMDVFIRLYQTLDLFLVGSLLSVPTWIALPGLLRGLLLIFLLYLFFLALRQRWRGTLENRALASAMLAFVVFTLGLHAVWEAQEPRYVLPILPILVLWGVEGFETLTNRLSLNARKVTLVGGLALVLGTYGTVYASLVRQSSQDAQSPAGRLAAGTYQWVRQSLPENTLILCGKPSELCLYTGRMAVGPVRADDAMHFRLALLKTGVTHVLTRPVSVGLLGHQGQDAWNANLFWTSTWPTAFKKIYENPEESMTGFEVIPSAGYAALYARYQSARQKELTGAREAAFQVYAQLLKTDPTLLPVYVRLGELALATGTHVSQALSSLEQVPNSLQRHPYLLVLQAKLWDQKGDPRQAERCRRQARQEASQQPAFASLLSVIQ